MPLTSTETELLPLAGLNSGPVRPHYPRLTYTQRLLPDLKSGKLNALLLAGAEGSGKSVLATELVRLLESEGFFSVAVMATPFQPLSTGRILALFETLFLHHGLFDEWEAVCDPLIGVEDRLAVCTTVMNQKLSLILVLDGLESCLDAETGRFLEPSMEAFFTNLLNQLNGVSRVIITSRFAPQWHVPVPLSQTFQQEILPVYEGLVVHGKTTTLPQLSQKQWASLWPLTVFHYNSTLSGYCAVMQSDPQQSLDRLHFLQKLGLSCSFLGQGLETLWHLHPVFRKAAKDVAQNLDESQKENHRRAGTFLAGFIQGGGWNSKKNKKTGTPENPLGVHWLDVALEAVGHFLYIGAFEEALQCAKPVSDYFSQRNFLWEQERLNRKLLMLGEHPRPHYLIALVLLKRHCQEEAQHRLTRVLSFGEELFPKESALALFELAKLSTRQQPIWAKNYLLRSLAINQRCQDRSGQAVCYAHLGFLGMQQGDIYEAQTHLNSALDLCRELQDKKGMANLLPWTGELYYRVGSVGQARSHFQEALTLLQNPGCTEIETQLRHRLAMIDLGEERFSQALEGFLQALNIHRTMKNKKGEVAVFFQLGRLAKAMGQQEASLHFLGMCQCIDQEIGDSSAFQELTLFQEIATTVLGLGKTAAQTILEQMQILYRKDGGESLIEKTFRGGA